MLDPLVKEKSPNELEFNVPFTQYLRPDGRKRRVEITVQGDQALGAKKILDNGLVFEIEELTTLEISMTLSNGEEDVCIRLCENGPPVMAALKELINDGVAWIESCEG